MTFQFVSNLRNLSSIRSALWQCVRYRRWKRRGGALPNKLDPDKDFFMAEAFESEPVAYLDESPMPRSKSKKLTPREEREQQKKLLKQVILKKKEMKENLPREPSLLTWAARAQIKYLHQLDPDHWDLETLSRSFPVSVFAIKEILRSKHIPFDRKEIYKHDRTVYKNWMKLREQALDYIEGKQVDPEYRHLLEDEAMRASLAHAAGIADLPVPQEQQIVKTMTDLAEDARPIVKREFSSILDNYQRSKQNPNAVSNNDADYIGFKDHEMQMLLEDIARLSSKDVKSEDKENTDESLEDTRNVPSLTGDYRNFDDYTLEPVGKMESYSVRSINKGFRSKELEKVKHTHGQNDYGTSDFKSDKYRDNSQKFRSQFGNSRSKDVASNRKLPIKTGKSFQHEVENYSLSSRMEKKTFKNQRDNKNLIYHSAEGDERFNKNSDRREDMIETFSDDSDGGFSDRTSNQLTCSLEDIYILKRSANSKGFKGRDKGSKMGNSKINSDTEL